MFRLGVSSVVLEQAESLRTTGTSLTLFKNGWRVLDAIGVANDLRPQFLEIQGYINRISQILRTFCQMIQILFQLNLFIISAVQDGGEIRGWKGASCLQFQTRRSKVSINFMLNRCVMSNILDKIKCLIRFNVVQPRGTCSRETSIIGNFEWKASKGFHSILIEAIQHWVHSKWWLIVASRWWLQAPRKGSFYLNILFFPFVLEKYRLNHLVHYFYERMHRWNTEIDWYVLY